MRYFYKTYLRCDTSVVLGNFEREMFLPKVNSFTFNGLLNTDGSYSTEPVWFSQVNDYPAQDTFWLMTPPNDGNTYRFSWTANNADGSEDEYVVELVNLAACSEIVSVKDCNETLIVWLNREGGWSQFYFTGKTTYEVQIPDGKTYINSDFVQRYFDRGKVYRGELLTTGDIPVNALDLMESLKYSLQAYKVDYSNPLDIKYIPILLQDGDYTKRKTGDKIFDVSVKMIYAQEVTIQTG